MWGEQVLRSLSFPDNRGIARDAPKRCVKWKECRPERHVPPLATLQEAGAVGELSYDAVTAALGNRIREPPTSRPERSSGVTLRTMDLVHSQRGYETETVVRQMLSEVRGQNRGLPFPLRGCLAKHSDVVTLSSRSGSGAQGDLLVPIHRRQQSRGKGADSVRARGLIAWGRRLRKRWRRYQLTTASDRAVKKIISQLKMEVETRLGC